VEDLEIYMADDTYRSSQVYTQTDSVKRASQSTYLLFIRANLIHSDPVEPTFEITPVNRNYGR